MGRFPSIHCTDVGRLKRILRKQGFTPEELCQDEVVRMRHSEYGVAIAWRKARNTPFQRINPVAATAWEKANG